jgi:hypothetical protein
VNAVTFLKVYACIQGLMIAGYLLFSAIRHGLKSLPVQIGYRQWIVIAQMIIGLSILAPCAFHALPQAQTPTINWSFLRPAPEGGARKLHQDSRPFVQKDKAVIQADLVASEKVRTIRLFLSSLLQTRMPTFLALSLIFGVLFFFARLSIMTRQLLRLLSSSEAVRKIGKVRIVVSEEISIPFSFSLGKSAWVALPMKILGSNRDFRIAVTHELQHHRQRDVAWAVWVEALICFFFPNPAIWLFKRDIIELQEFSCDEVLLGQRRISKHEYGSCLVRVAEAALGFRQVQVGTTCMATASKNPTYVKSFLRRRIEMFANQRSSARSWAGRWVGTIAAFATVALAYGTEQSIRNVTEPVINPGSIVVDPAIQQIAENALSEAIKSENAKAGFAIVADPNTGRILAVANIDTSGKLKGHWALSEAMEPASLAKTLVAAEAIESGKTTPDESHSCENGSYKYGSRVYHDWRDKGWDHLTTTETVAMSGDICSLKIGEEVGGDGLMKMLADYGFGPDGSTRSFPEASAGALPPSVNPLWPELIPAIAYGYGFRSTPLEMVQAYGAIANGGNLLMPKLANDTSSPQIVRRVLSSDNAAKLKEILRQVVVQGTGKGNAESRLYSTAGKTASSYVPDVTQQEPFGGAKKSNLASFIGFAPAMNPQIEVYIGIRDPHTEKEHGAHGATHAAPVFTKITDAVLKHMNVAPDKPQS